MLDEFWQAAYICVHVRYFESSNMLVPLVNAQTGMARSSANNWKDYVTCMAIYFAVYCLYTWIHDCTYIQCCKLVLQALMLK